MAQLVEVKITENPNTCTVVYRGRTHSCRWGNNERIYKVKGESAYAETLALLRAALVAWDGPLEFTLTEEELALRSGGWWSVKP